jgi:hypothetical protein
MKKLLQLAAIAVLTLNAALWGASITVYTPPLVTGNDLCVGCGPYVINWVPVGTTQTVTIALRYAGSASDAAPALVIATGEENNGSYKWQIPSSVAPGDYFIRVRTDDATVIGDGAVFTICLEPVITVTFPHETLGKMPYKILSTHLITWKKKCYMQNTVTIALRYAGSATKAAPALVIATGEANDGSFTWKIPASVAPGDYFVRVRTDDATVIGDGGKFHISAAGRPVPEIR